MNKIDTYKWKEYKIEELFNIHPTNHYNMTNNELFLNIGDIPVIVNSAYNNGVGGYVNLKPTEKGGIITFSDTTDANSIFYQPKDFIGYSHVQGMYPKFDKISDNAMQYIATIFKIKALTMGYNYANKFRRDIAEKLTIKLPVNQKGDLDLEYMESFMENIMKESEKKIKNLQNINNSKKKINLNNWEKFKIGALFEPLKTGFIGNGKKIGSATKKTDEEHSIPLTCAKYGDNGIMYWGKKGDFITHSNILAVIRDGAIATGMVYAEKEETGVYSHSYFIKLKNYDVSFEVNLYLSCILTKTIYPKYTRDDTCIWERIKEDEILLPVSPENEPDWKYMENYMKNIMANCESKLENLKLCI